MTEQPLSNIRYDHMAPVLADYPSGCGLWVVTSIAILIPVQLEDALDTHGGVAQL